VWAGVSLPEGEARPGSLQQVGKTPGSGTSLMSCLARGECPTTFEPDVAERTVKRTQVYAVKTVTARSKKRPVVHKPLRRNAEEGRIYPTQGRCTSDTRPTGVVRSASVRKRRLPEGGDWTGRPYRQRQVSLAAQSCIAPDPGLERGFPSGGTIGKGAPLHLS